ncbi:MAG: TetR/AcrR family transcriptional regulator [Treponema sp.]|nr:TetR/AcrR family transcriptional regulator [Treponema sp.]
MAIVVEHEKRRIEILEKALTVFMDDGYEDATFQRIADRCGITRTTLYIYFKNKKDIFNFSIKQLMNKAEQGIQKISSDKSLNSVEKITKVLLYILELLEQNRRLLYVILDYLLHYMKSEGSPEAQVRRRTVRLRHIISSMVIDGIKTGELKKVNVKAANIFLFSIIETAIFHLVVLKRKNLGELGDMAAFAVKLLAV